jgi:hypothetical protein
LFIKDDDDIGGNDGDSRVKTETAEEEMEGTTREEGGA